ncbi:STAS domain-containing protein [Nonomuraea sp. CA-141351]|uniref:STAS domain-containing protein n=1 Tax=Nonomuraea sp. CA-141351 TaxID=3239996 RepID=UPI003D91B162
MTAALEHHRAAVLDLSGVAFIDCAGLGFLIAAFNHAEHHGRTLILRSPGRQVRRLLHLAGVHQRLPIQN